jgi:methanogenic corrinoid protein MtbC1
MADYYASLRQSMAELDEDAVLRIVGEIAESGGEGASQALEACQDGIKEVGDKFEAGEYYIGELLFASEIMQEALEGIKPFLSAGLSGGKGKVLLCTVYGDIHDIGKNIVKSMLEIVGFYVVDLGINVPTDTILQTVKSESIRIVALSGVLTLALDSMKAVVDGFKEAGMRDDVKIIIGGNPVTGEANKYVGADEWTLSPQKGVEICSRWAADADE